MTTLRRVVSRVVFAGVCLLYGCPSAGVDNPPPDPLKADAAVDAGPVVHPDAEPAKDADAPDAELIDTGFKLRSADFAPATGAAGSAEHQLNGSFGASSGASSSTGDRHKLRGSFGPLGR